MAPERARWVLLGGVWLIYFCFGLTAAAMAPMVTSIGADLGASNAAMGAAMGAWPLTYIVAAIPCGILLDRLGVRMTLFAATVIMAASGVARGFADTPFELMAAVAIFGFGGPMISVGAPKLIAGLFEGQARGTAMGVYVTGPYLGGMAALALTQSVAMPAMGDWRGVMFLYAGVVMVSGFVWLGLTALAGTGPEDAEGGKKFSLPAFLDILRLREVQIILAMSVGIFFINHGLNSWLPEVLRAKGLSAVSAGYWASISSAVGVVGALVVPRLATPERRLAVMAALFVSTLGASLLLHVAPGPWLVVALVAQGVARGSMMTVAILLLMETRGIAKERLGLAGGLFFTTAEIGGVLGPLGFGVLSGWSGGFAVPLFAVSLVAVGLLVLLVSLWLVQRMLTMRGSAA